MTFAKKPTIAGLPLHGLVTDQVLPVSGGNPDMNLPAQPPARNVLLNTARNAPALERSSQQQESDTDKGYDWKDRLLVPGVTGILPTDIVFIDDAQIPYLVRIIASKTGPLEVTVTATLVREYGIISASHRADFDVEMCNQVIDLSVGAQANLLSVKDSPDTVFGAVEQSPSGAEALVNIAANFSSDAQYYLRSQNDWAICSILKIAMSGQFDPVTRSGVTATPAHHKTAADCCAPRANSVISAPVYKKYYMGQTETLQGWTPGGGANDWLGAVMDMQSTFFNYVLVEGGGGSIPTGTDESEDSQSIIVYGHYDNAGAEQILSFYLSANTSISYGSPTVDYTMLPATIDWSYHCDHPFGSNPGTFECDMHPPTAGSGVDATKNIYQDTSKTETRTYTVELRLNGGVEGSKVYVWSDANTVISDIDYDYTEWPSSLDDGLFISADQADEEAPWLFPSFEPNRIWSPTTKNIIDWPGGTGAASTTVNTNTDSHVYTSTEWGEVLYTGPVAPTDEGFDNFDLDLIGERFLALINTRTGNKAPAQSAYGASVANHGANITYDPYEDVISDSDDPVGYV